MDLFAFKIAQGFGPCLLDRAGERFNRVFKHGGGHFRFLFRPDFERLEIAGKLFEIQFRDGRHIFAHRRFRRRRDLQGLGSELSPGPGIGICLDLRVWFGRHGGRRLGMGGRRGWGCRLAGSCVEVSGCGLLDTARHLEKGIQRMNPGHGIAFTRREPHASHQLAVEFVRRQELGVDGEYALEMLFGLIELEPGEIAFSQHEMGAGVMRVLAQPHFADLHRLVNFAKLQISIRQASKDRRFRICAQVLRQNLYFSGIVITHHTSPAPAISERNSPASRSRNNGLSGVYPQYIQSGEYYR